MLATVFFYGSMIDHYAKRLQDPALPLQVRQDFKKAYAMYLEKYNALNAAHIDVHKMIAV